jgi:hypothetical protein
MDTSVVKIAKAFAETGRAWLDEYQLTKMIFDHAQLDRRAGEQPAARTPQRRPDPSWERADVLYYTYTAVATADGLII